MMMKAMGSPNIGIQVSIGQAVPPLRLTARITASTATEAAASTTAAKVDGEEVRAIC